MEFEESKINYALILKEMIGDLSNYNNDELIRNYGITLEEYLHPNKEVISKVTEYLDNKNTKHR